jgi:hypothetical protein
MLDGSDSPPPDFNWAFLVCLPKAPGLTEPSGLEMHEAGNTRPLSIVDASNRILANIFRIALERRVGTWISPMQRGFLQGRQMLRNVLDIDFGAQKISVKSKSGVLMLFDFKAAFPSMSHDFMWDTLLAIGLPPAYINMLKLFYTDNNHTLCLGGQDFPSVVVRSGVRQGCPLSPLLFALCADVLLRELGQILCGDELARAFADDTAAVINDYKKTIPAMSKLLALLLILVLMLILLMVSVLLLLLLVLLLMLLLMLMLLVFMLMFMRITVHVNVDVAVAAVDIGAAVHVACCECCLDC